MKNAKNEYIINILPLHRPFQKLLQDPEHLEYLSYLGVLLHQETLFPLSHLFFQVPQCLLWGLCYLFHLGNHLCPVDQVSPANHLHP